MDWEKPARVIEKLGYSTPGQGGAQLAVEREKSSPRSAGEAVLRLGLQLAQTGRISPNGSTPWRLDCAHGTGIGEDGHGTKRNRYPGSR